MTKSKTTINKLAIIKHKVERSTLFFTRYFFKKKFNRKFVVSEHHEIITKALDRVLSGEITRLIINIAPRYGKTELAVKNFIAKGLSINPSARFIHLSYSDDLALDNSDEVRELIKHESYQELFPDVQVKPNSDSKKKWYTTKSGGVYATSAAGQVTGFGAGQVDEEEEEEFSIEHIPNNFGGALIIDDPIKPEDGDSEVKRDRINMRFDSTIKNRVNSRKTPIIIIMQRVHENDLCGYLIEKNPEDWHVVSLPCIKKDGTALWPFKHTIEELNKLKYDNELVFERQYQQDPQPLKGLLFPSKELRYFKPDPKREFDGSLAYADVADEGDDSLAAPIGRNVGTDVYITDVLFNKENTDVTIPLLAQKIKDNNVKYIRVESNNMGAMYGRNLAKDIDAQVLFVTSSTYKHTRIIMDAAFIRKHFLFVHPDYQTQEYKAFMKELTSYLKVGGSKHDDAPDALTGLSTFVRGMLPHLYE
jgi:predicted phage terminase large subunit-like protein